MANYSIKAGDVVLTPDRDASTAQSVWEVKWEINERKDEKRYVGSLWFNGEPEMGVVDIDFSIEHRFIHSGYMRDVMRAIIDWVFSKRGIYEIKITVDAEDEDKVDIIERSGFIFRWGNKVTEKYSVVKARTAWTGLYLPLGVIAGIGMGVLFNSMIGGICAGVVIGLMVGVILDTKANVERSKVTGERKVTHRKAVLEYENSENDPPISVSEAKKAKRAAEKKAEKVMNKKNKSGNK